MIWKTISAVIVPLFLALQEDGYGIAKGIPTLVIASSSIDDVLEISIFTIILGITFKPDTNLTAAIFQVLLPSPNTTATNNNKNVV